MHIKYVSRQFSASDDMVGVGFARYTCQRRKLSLQSQIFGSGRFDQLIKLTNYKGYFSLRSTSFIEITATKLHQRYNPIQSTFDPYPPSQQARPQITTAVF